MKSPEKEKVVNLKYEFKEYKVCAMIFGRVICFFKGHKRGKPTVFDGNGNAALPGEKFFRCSRCGRVRKYKVKSA